LVAVYWPAVRRRHGYTVATLSVVATLAALPVAGCLSQGEGFLHLGRGSADAGPPPSQFIDGSSSPFQEASLPPLAPHSVRAVDPTHGPFEGGSHAIVRGTGFSSVVRVWFGDVQVPPSDVLAVDPARIQVTVPAGKAGSVDVATQNGDDASTRTTLPNGFTYDAFYLDPASGPVGGGTLVTVHGDGTAWDPTTRVLVDGNECAFVALESPDGKPQQLTCTMPPGTAGAKSVQIVTEGGTADVQDGYTYGDSDNGFRGGLAGDPLKGSLRVVVLNSATGGAVPGATVVLGSEATADSVKKTDSGGVVVVRDSAVSGKVTVTIAAKCLQPTTFVDVPVDTVTAYLDPILTLDCAAGGFGGIGGGGGTSRPSASIDGELVWPGGIEFKRAPWDVPTPSDVASGALERVAYVFELSPDATRDFRLASASNAVNPTSDGRLGYGFETSASFGNLTLYALAGIEDTTRTPALFTAYTLGVLQGVPTSSGNTTSDVYVPMDIPLDHAVRVTVDGPTPTPRGPDRVQVRLSVRLGTLGYVILPMGAQETLLPSTSTLSFVGVPPLVGELAGAEYALTAAASSGAGHTLPRSVLAARVTSTPTKPLPLGGFVNVPDLVTPARNTAWDARDLEVTAAPGGADADLTMIDVTSDGGLTDWLVVAPRGVTKVRLPDLGSLGVAGGPVTIGVTRANIDAFVYGSLRYGQLGTGTFHAYALDSFQVHH
jgi:hypothetical protein